MNSKIKKRSFYLLILGFILFFSYSKISTLLGYDIRYTTGQKIDSLNNVMVYYNGSTNNISGRNLTADNYNLGLKYQCVEFIKRYYYEYLNHKMPNAFGNAVDFYDPNVKDGELNTARNLIQYSNFSDFKPKINDIVILDGTVSNEFGHIAIISEVSEEEIEIIQQNTGGKTRAHFDLEKENNKWIIDNKRVLGRLRMKK